jgi:electron transport complex protein RnfB
MSIVAVTIILAAATLLILAVVMSAVLGVANKSFHVPVDVRVEKVIAALPGANCGGCDYVGCSDYAEAIVAKGEDVTRCPVGGDAVSREVARIMGVEIRQTWPMRPVVHCAATYDKRKRLTAYDGERTCHAANIVSGLQGCVYGCLGLGDCVRVCEYDAIHVVDGLARVDYTRCTGCGACVKACPRNIISRIPFKASRVIAVLCANKDFGKEVSDVCEVGCIGCKACARIVSDLITIQNNLPVFDYDKYDPSKDLQAIIDKCPRASLVWIGKPTARDLQETAEEALPARIEANFKTTVDKTEWRG